MKNLVIIMGTVILGAYVFNMMVGNESNTLKSVSEKAMRKTIELYNDER